MRLYLLGIAITCTLWIGLSGWADETGPSEQQVSYMKETLVHYNYGEIKSTSLNILRKYPPDQYYYVGIGRSPVPIVAFFEELGIKGVSTIPISAMRKLDKESAPAKAALQSRIKAHLNQWFPSKKELAGRKVLLLDYASSADGIIAVTREISDFASAQRPQVEVRAVGLFGMDKTGLKLAENHIDPIKIPKISGSMTYSSYEIWAKVGKWNPWDPKSKSFKPRSEYQIYKNALAEEMRRDLELKAQIPKNQLASFEKQSLIECASQQLRDATQ